MTTFRYLWITGLFLLTKREVYGDEAELKKTACEHKTLSLTCDGESTLDIHSALYGRLNTETCPHNLDHSTSCRAEGALQKVRDACQHQSSCGVKAVNGVFGDPCVGVFKYLEVSYTCENKGWHLVFKGVSEAGDPDLYHLWRDDGSLNALNHSARALNDSLKANFKSPMVDRWTELEIQRVKIAFYKDGVQAAYMIFNGRDTGKMDWFALDKVTSSSYEDLNDREPNFFSIKGHSSDKHNRHWFSNRNYGGCQVDYGWTVVLTGKGPCGWDNRNTDYPQIMFSPTTTGVLWESDQPAWADFFAVFLEYTDHCPYEVVVIADVTYTFEASPANFLANSLEMCSSRENNPRAVRMCNSEPQGGSVWGEVSITLCDIDDINGLTQVTVTEDNVDDVASQLSTLTGDENVEEELNINDVASILESITEVGVGNQNVTMFTVEIVSNVQNADYELFMANNQSMAASSRIVQSLETQLESLTNFTHVQDNVAVHTMMFNPTTLENGIGFASIQPSINGAVEKGLQKENIKQFEDVQDYLNQMIETSIALPPEIVNKSQEQAGSNDLQVSFTIYQTSKLFTSYRLMTKENRTIGTRVISAAVERVTVAGLKEPVRAAYLPIVKGAGGNPECVFWDFDLENGQGDWSNEGCVYNETSDDRIVCFCDHLTNFAVIMDYSGQAGPTTGFQDALTYISVIGCVISIVCLVITIFTFMYFKHLRGKRPQRILLNLCFSLLFLYLTFVIGIELTKCYSCCIIVAIMLHYFVLTSLFWMLVEAINMYLKFVLVFYEEIRCFMLKSVILGWGVPIIPVAIIASINYEEIYSNDEYCFMKPGLEFYLGLLAIAAVILIINSVIYIQVIRQLTCRRKLTKVKTDKNKMSEVSVRVQNAITIMMLLGLTWIFGFLSIDSSDAVRDLFQLIFCVCNSLQGFFVFLFFCVRRRDVRNSWAYFCCKVGQKPGQFITMTSKQRYATEKTLVSANSTC
ncbi:adhesion G-protein coupled receptor G6-like [Anneissia japonica]|uniref:adhesion G-protein coupled receptor G6-like n=1 Tax=Anneissia japonica TaxID=1529436 RepID=UPI0014257407|nr:adhesion G-protein coupled receptor G6-like [Anneissia japonica]